MEIIITRSSDFFLQFIHLLLEAYGFRGAMMVVGAWALHSAVGACLLRPLEDKKGNVAKKVILHLIDNIIIDL